MKNLMLPTLVCCLLLGVTFVFAASGQGSAKKMPMQDESKAVKTESSVAANSFEPIDNMHHFMEYISQPSYKALKAAFAGDPPEGRRAWKGIKSHALILAETTAIVAKRTPKDATDEQKSEWKEISVEVYAAGKALYKSAGDFELAKKNYGVMIESCNKCHQVFDHGKHQLEK
jgi:hypothetical protein